MEFLTAGLAIVGLGMQIFGGKKQSDVSGQQAQLGAQEASLSGGISADEQQINVQKQQQMQLQASRAQLENFRTVQKVKAQGLSTATGQGAQFGSGLQGAQASETDQGLYNSLGISQNLDIGQNIFGITSDISSKNIAIAGLKGQSAMLGGQAATAQGLSSLGGALVGSAKTIGGFGKDISAGIGNPFSLWSGGSLSGGLGRT